MDAVTVPRATSSEHSRPSTGADLLGRSALPLLGSVTDATGPWLFVAARSVGSLSLGRLPEARFLRAEADYGGTWPFADGTLGGVVIDGDALARGANESVLQSILAEARRVNGRQGNVLVVCSHRFMPRRLRAWREYGRHTAERWRDAAATLGLNARTTGFVRLDDDRITDITLFHDECDTKWESRREADRLVLRVTESGRHEAEVITAIVTDASRHLGADLHIDRLSVRKIGKTAIFLSAAGGRRYMMRIARSPIALARATRNFDALACLHHSSLPESIGLCVPRSVVRGQHGGYPYFIETCVPGRPGPLAARSGRQYAGWNMSAAGFIAALHARTLQRVTLDESTMQRIVYEPVARVTATSTSPATETVLRRILAFCQATLERRTIPLVQTHGDFTESNCLFDERGLLTGVIDWEVSVAKGLPLLDLLQLMPVPGEASASPRWERFDAWLDLWRDPGLVTRDPVMGRYMRDLEVPPDAVRPLVLLQWLTHVADRVDARCDDGPWMRLRVWQPLERLGRILCD